jgi:hypothetical protein
VGCGFNLKITYFLDEKPTDKIVMEFEIDGNDKNKVMYHIVCIVNIREHLNE